MTIDLKRFNNNGRPSMSFLPIFSVTSRYHVINKETLITRRSDNISLEGYKDNQDEYNSNVFDTHILSTIRSIPESERQQQQIIQQLMGIYILKGSNS
ncbi:hypothetical protein V1478_005165 [Vespula squamosa]|uniref:Uncharacterized protein n=1 Tax=Vespula squamosa TaxID=30214 RepID=A0ABD2BDC6_VESSQ